MSPQIRTEVTFPGELTQVGLVPSLDLKEGNTDSLVMRKNAGIGWKLVAGTSIDILNRD